VRTQSLLLKPKSSAQEHAPHPMDRITVPEESTDITGILGYFCQRIRLMFRYQLMKWRHSIR